ncbi:hypothetical protein NPIL_197291 [Nephila pilipes]|uniref:Uncharacterized protein n=1 Tax=Nephila pilipes TaxID=299642 RepID=A0A8X6PL96_NEPPI|nr:hypothetical protein NPIL_197291 [Nephila pilipes]
MGNIIKLRSGECKLDQENGVREEGLPKNGVDSRARELEVFVIRNSVKVAFDTFLARMKLHLDMKEEKKKGNPDVFIAFFLFSSSVFRLPGDEIT